MKKILIPILILTVMTAACLPVAAPADSGPQVDTQATIDSIVNTSVAQTAQPTSTTVPVIDTSTPSHTPPPTHITVTLETTIAPNLTTTPATATSGVGDDSTITPTMPASSGEITLTPTLGVLTYGTLPPAVPSSQVTLINKSKAQAYISLQLCDTEAAGAILEYPVQSTVKINAPLGNYIYVVWVGGKQLTGTLKNNDGLKITIYKDKVVIQ